MAVLGGFEFDAAVDHFDGFVFLAELEIGFGQGVEDGGAVGVEADGFLGVL